MLIIDCFSSQLGHYLLSVNVILGLINTLDELTLGSLKRKGVRQREAELCLWLVAMLFNAR